MPQITEVISQPRRGSSLYTGEQVLYKVDYHLTLCFADHILGPAARLHPHLVYDLHDRTSFIDLKRAIKKNNGALKQAAPTMELMPSDQQTLATTYEIKSNPYAPKVN